MLASIRFGYHIQCDNFQIGEFWDDLTTWHIVMFIDRFPAICLQMPIFFANIACKSTYDELQFIQFINTNNLHDPSDISPLTFQFHQPFL